jgi:hypothetical protein
MLARFAARRLSRAFEKTEGFRRGMDNRAEEVADAYVRQPACTDFALLKSIVRGKLVAPYPI